MRVSVRLSAADDRFRWGRRFLRRDQRGDENAGVFVCSDEGQIGRFAAAMTSSEPASGDLISWDDLFGAPGHARVGRKIAIDGWMMPFDGVFSSVGDHEYFLILPEPASFTVHAGAGFLFCLEAFARKPMKETGRPLRFTGLTVPACFGDYRQLPALAAAMTAFGFNRQEMGKILGENYVRVFRQCQSGG